MIRQKVARIVEEMIMEKNCSENSTSKVVSLEAQTRTNEAKITVP